MAVDFASKQRERAGDGWALRNLKLRMSRKLIFVSGLLTCFSCLHDPSPSLKTLSVGTDQPIEPLVNHLKKYVNSTPLEIVAHSLFVYGASNETCKTLFDSYDLFVDKLNDPEVRVRLKELKSSDAESSELFQKMRTVSHNFQDALTTLFFETNKDLTKLVQTYGVF